MNLTERIEKNESELQENSKYKLTKDSFYSFFLCFLFNLFFLFLCFVDQTFYFLTSDLLFPKIFFGVIVGISFLVNIMSFSRTTNYYEKMDNHTEQEKENSVTNYAAFAGLFLIVIYLIYFIGILFSYYHRDIYFFDILIAFVSTVSFFLVYSMKNKNYPDDICIFTDKDKDKIEKEIKSNAKIYKDEYNRILSSEEILIEIVDFYKTESLTEIEVELIEGIFKDVQEGKENINKKDLKSRKYEEIIQENFANQNDIEISNI